ncbi:MAG: phosphoheptose isomerase, partial [Sphingobium sp.]
YILDAEPDARLGIGLTRPLSPAAFRAAALDGSLEDLIDWKPVKAGDCFFIPAGTVHAIGAGITLAEVQQNVDVTYRLYDYGRPRELHLDDGAAVSRLEPYRRLPVEARLGEERRLVSDEEAPFWLDLRALNAGEQVDLPGDERLWFLPLSGTGAVDDQRWSKGECWLIDGQARITVEDSGAALLAAARRATR